MVLADRIASDPEILLGKPVIRGTRVAVSFLLEALTSMSTDEIIAAYPFLTRDDVEAALRYAALVVDSQGDENVEVSS